MYFAMASSQWQGVGLVASREVEAVDTDFEWDYDYTGRHVLFAEGMDGVIRCLLLLAISLV
jgi:hypothetical protein